jgi:purine nucleosidase
MAALPIYYDCDPGQDDALALLYALGSKTLRVTAVTVAGGNADVAQCARNAQQVLELAGRVDIPVHVGAEKPLKRVLKTLPDVFGPTGMAGAEDLPAPSFPLSPVSARRALAQIPANQTVVATAPLTNLAHAFADDAALPGRISRLFIMGGCAYPEPLRGQMGNFPVEGCDGLAEYNFAIDPEAAQIVFAAGVPEIFMVGLNITRGLLYNGRIDARLRALKSRAARKVADILSAVGKEDVEDYADLRQTPDDPVRAMHDVLAMACCERQDLFTFETRPLKIVTEAPPAAAGQSLIIEKGFDHPAVRIATAVNAEAFIESLVANLGNLP